MTTYTATYSPDDNKMRLYASSRLDKETYDRVKAAGFRWAPKQELFVAPSWTPEREDLLVELAGEVEDEDKSLVDRAEERAERFDDLSEKRQAAADAAHKAVAAIADNIPLGQPILVGHHSERHARRDAERIESGMRRAVKMWETSKYWTARAAGALRHAKYKELPGVRHRRIKTLASERRKVEKNREAMVKNRATWANPELTLEQARRIAGQGYYYLAVEAGDFTTAYDVLRDDPPKWPLEKVVASFAESYPRRIALCDRWLAHYDNRLAYEQAMLDEQIGAEGELGKGMGGRFDIKPGGKVMVGRDGWLVVIRVNKANGVINSVTTQAPAAVTWSKTWKYGVEKIVDYQPPSEEMAAKVKKATALPPICNYPVEGCKEMTQAEWALLMKRKWSDFPYYGVCGATSTAGKHRVRQAPAGMMKKQYVFITDAKRVDPPKPEQADPLPQEPRQRFPVDESTNPSNGWKAPERTTFDDMKDALKNGVKVVAVRNLFPTPPGVAKRAAEMAGIENAMRVLEPSAGTGNLVDEIVAAADEGAIEVTAIEVNPQLADALRGRWSGVYTICCDFLQFASDPFYDRAVMNPPFENGTDIKHVEHALTMLRPGGRLVAIVAGGPRQEKAFKHRASEWEELPSGTFEGTGVRAVLMAIDKGAADVDSA
jgi:phospholipid N-methyltransferase